MSLDTTALGKIAAEMMESLAAAYEEHDVTVGEVALIVEVDGEDWTAVTYRCTTPKAWVQLGLMHAGISAVHATRNVIDDEDDGEEQ